MKGSFIHLQRSFFQEHFEENRMLRKQHFHQPEETFWSPSKFSLLSDRLWLLRILTNSFDAVLNGT